LIICTYPIIFAPYCLVWNINGLLINFCHDDVYNKKYLLIVTKV
jgi:hypothetical protein